MYVRVKINYFLILSLIGAKKKKNIGREYDSDRIKSIFFPGDCFYHLSYPESHTNIPSLLLCETRVPTWFACTMDEKG